jgi:uncharacterized protein (TIGR02996 family)
MNFDDPSFFEAIRQQPGDDTLRLVYADWVEEHDEPARAEFIRLQVASKVELAPGGRFRPPTVNGFSPVLPGGEGADAALRRQMQLYASRVRKWNSAVYRRLRNGPLHRSVNSRRGIICGWTYRRGFPCTVLVRMSLAAASCLTAAFQIGPIERLNLTGASHVDDLQNILQQLDVNSSSLRILDLSRVQVSSPWWLQQVQTMLSQRTRYPCLQRLEQVIGPGGTLHHATG